MNIDFPNKAGKLLQVLETQKRLLFNLSRQKQNEDVAALMIATAEGYDVGKELLTYMKETIQDVANDADALADGARVRNTVQEQSELLNHLLNK